MNKPASYLFIIALLSIFFPKTSIAESSSCNSILFVVQSENLINRRQLCKGETLEVSDQTLITCRYKPGLQSLKTGTYDAEKICPSRQTDLNVCESDNSCYRNISNIRLIGNTFASQDSMPVLRWTEIYEANGYEIVLQSISSADFRRILVSKNEYIFDKPLTRGELYQITIYAVGTESLGKFAFRIPSQSQIDQLTMAHEIIQSSNLSDVEKVVYADSIYMHIGLLVDTITALEQAPALSSSIELQMLLGDRYIEAGYFDKARKLHENVVQRAPSDSPEHAKAMRYIMSYNQLPTSTKAPQE